MENKEGWKCRELIQHPKIQKLFHRLTQSSESCTIDRRKEKLLSQQDPRLLSMKRQHSFINKNPIKRKRQVSFRSKSKIHSTNRLPTYNLTRQYCRGIGTKIQRYVPQVVIKFNLHEGKIHKVKRVIKRKKKSVYKNASKRLNFYM